MAGGWQHNTGPSFRERVLKKNKGELLKTLYAFPTFLTLQFVWQQWEWDLGGWCEHAACVCLCMSQGNKQAARFSDRHGEKTVLWGLCLTHSDTLPDCSVLQIKCCEGFFVQGGVDFGKHCTVYARCVHMCLCGGLVHILLHNVLHVLRTH